MVHRIAHVYFILFYLSQRAKELLFVCEPTLSLENQKKENKKAVSV